MLDPFDVTLAQGIRAAKPVRRWMALGRAFASVPIVFTFLTVAADAQGPSPGVDLDIVTDRPDITESSIVVPRGSLQIENGLTWTASHTNEVIDFSETLMRLGIASRTELRAVVPNYVDGLTGPPAASGFGDVSFGIKQQLGPLHAGFGLSVILGFSLPTGADAISSKEVRRMEHDGHHARRLAHHCGGERRAGGGRIAARQGESYSGTGIQAGSLGD